MLSIFGKLFGSAKAVERIVESTASALDKLVYTNEEKAEAAAKQREKARDQVVDFMAATSGQNLARRLIALIIVGIWAGCYVMSVGMVVVAVFITGELATQLREASSLIDSYISGVEGSLILILTFYFGAPHVENVVRAVVEGRRAKATLDAPPGIRGG